MTLHHRGNGVYGSEPRNHVKSKHGLSGTAAHRSWIAMLQRCYNPKCERYASYGGRGISVCDRWRDDFRNFFADMGERPAGHSLERRNPDLGYYKENCRWATTKDQSRNKTTSLMVTINGETKSLAEWAEISGIDYHALHKRIRAGVPQDKLLERSGAFLGKAIKGRKQSAEHVEKRLAAQRRFFERKRAAQC